MKPSTVRAATIGLGLFLAAGLLLTIARGDAAGAHDVSAAIVAVLVFGGIGYVAWRIRTGPRRDASRDEARNAGLTIVEGDPLGLIDLPHPLLGRIVTVRGIDNVMVGSWAGVPVTVFDYWYARSGDPTIDDVERFSCLLTPLDNRWPDVTIDPETPLTRATGRVTMREIDMESEAFNRAFTVRSTDRRFVNALVDARMMRWLLELGGGWGFELVGGRLLCYRSPQVQPWELTWFLETSLGFVAHVPSVVASIVAPAPIEPGPP
jgi:hypothetical protein